MHVRVRAAEANLRLVVAVEGVRVRTSHTIPLPAHPWIKPKRGEIFRSADTVEQGKGGR